MLFVDYGIILSAPSTRMTSPLTYLLVTTDSTILAYSSGSPRRAGCGTVLARNPRTYRHKVQVALIPMPIENIN